MSTLSMSAIEVGPFEAGSNFWAAGCDNQGVSFATLRLFSAERAERLRKRGMVVSRPGLKYSELR